MIIHKVKKGESVYSIAEKYGISPSIITENNALFYPDRLPVGRELIILIPTRTYTARKGDRAEEVCRRFSIDTDELMKNNPTLSDLSKIYPERTIALKYPDRSHGLIFTSGYLYEGCRWERLSSMLRYLSEVVLCSHIYDKKGIRKIFETKKVCTYVREKNKRLSIRIYPMPPYSEDRFGDGIAMEFIKAATEITADGIVLPLPEAAEEKIWLPFIEKLSRAAQEAGLSLTLECTKNTPKSILTSCERIILSRDMTLEVLCGEKDNELSYYNDIYTRIKAERAMLDLSPFAYKDKEPIPIDSALSECDKNCYEIFDGEFSDTLYFTDGNKKFTIPSLEYIKAKLDLVGELGFMGVCIDILRCPRSHIMALSSMFHIC